MRCALVGPTYPFRGGISHYTTSLYEAVSREHQVFLVSFSRQYPRFVFPGRTQRDASRGQFRAPGHALIDSLNPRTWRRAARHLSAFRPDVVVFQWWQPFFGVAYSAVVRTLKKESNVPVVYLCHNIFPHERFTFPLGSSLEKRLIQMAFGRVDGFLVHSEEMIEQVRRFNKTVPVQKIYHPLYEFYERWDGGPTSRVSEAKRNLLFFGTIRPYKGLEVFLKALPLIDRSIEFEAVVAGEFYMDSTPFKRLVEKLGVSEKVVWLDHYIANERVPELFRKADLAVLPYLSATQSGVVPLAYQFNLPVVATDVGGLSEVVLDGETGYLVRVGDPVALAARISDFFRNDKGRSFRENIQRFKQRLSWQQVIDNILTFLNHKAVDTGLRGNHTPRADPRDEL